MAAASTATKVVRSVDEHPAVVAAEARLTPIRERRRALEAEFQTVHRVGGFTNQYTHEPGLAISEEERTVARIRLAEIPGELRRLRVDELPAERAVAKAREDAQAELLKAIDARRRLVVAKLDSALAQAALVNAELGELDRQAEAVVGPMAVKLAWHELAPETATTPTRLAEWRRFAGSNDML